MDEWDHNMVQRDKRITGSIYKQQVQVTSTPRWVPTGSVIMDFLLEQWRTYLFKVFMFTREQSKTSQHNHCTELSLHRS
jgi:hypothetical protein